jgi:hypothetical protein
MARLLSSLHQNLCESLSSSAHKIIWNEISNLKNLKYYNIVSLDRQLQPLNNEGVTSSAISFGSLASSYSINLFLLLFIFATNFTSIDFLRSINIDTLTSS